MASNSGPRPTLYLGFPEDPLAVLLGLGIALVLLAIQAWLVPALCFLRPRFCLGKFDAPPSRVALHADTAPRAVVTRSSGMNRPTAIHCRRRTKVENGFRSEHVAETEALDNYKRLYGPISIYSM